MLVVTVFVLNVAVAARPVNCDADDAAIYSLVVRELHFPEHETASRLLIPAHSQNQYPDSTMREWLEGKLSPELMTSTLEHHMSAVGVPLRFCGWKLPMKPEFYSGSDYAQLVKPGVLVVQLSQIGYSDDGTQALVYEAFRWESDLHGYGHFSLLRRANKGWHVIKRIRVWGPVLSAPGVYRRRDPRSAGSEEVISRARNSWRGPECLN